MGVLYSEMKWDSMFHSSCLHCSSSCLASLHFARVLSLANKRNAIWEYTHLYTFSTLTEAFCFHDPLPACLLHAGHGSQFQVACASVTAASRILSTKILPGCHSMSTLAAMPLAFTDSYVVSKWCTLARCWKTVFTSMFLLVCMSIKNFLIGDLPLQTWLDWNTFASSDRRNWIYPFWES